MTPIERADLLERLEAGRADLLASVKGMPDAEADVRPSPERWSAIGNIEHVALVETNLMRILLDAPPGEIPATPGRELKFYEGLKNRARKVQAPERAHPKGEVHTVTEAIAKFEAARSITTAFVESCGHDPRRCSLQHPVLGPITGMECLFIVAAHPLRHADQIRELRGQATRKAT
jgi:hypothetical protein